MCRGCWKRQPWLARQVSGVRIAADFDGSWRKAILAYKFGGRATFRRPFARVLQHAALGLQVDAVLGVPASRAAIRSRGFDHVERLARPLAGHLGLPFLKRALRRRREGVKQAGLDRAQRLANVKGAYGARLGATERGLRLLLVDDVMTTGATLEACVQRLLRAGALSVDCVVLAARR
jgi:ComF family protein